MFEQRVRARARSCALLWRIHTALKIVLFVGANIEALQDKTGHTPLHWAAIGGNTKMCFLLVLKGRLCWQQGCRYFFFFLVVCCAQRFTDVDVVVIGADPLKRDALGQNGLMHAAQYGKVMTCYFFLHASQFYEDVETGERC
jgi:ankyrin repeat protein